MPLPPLYARWIDELLGAPLPEQPRSTCDSCAMLPRDEPRLAEETRFQAPMKCCTYYPDLPAFSVGAILCDPDAPGRRELEARIAAGPGVSPLGIERPPSYHALYGAAAPEAFGNTHSLRCSFHGDDGSCGIWRHRNAICATWFCKHERGAIGRTLMQSAHKLLYVLEKQLSLWCALELAVGDDALRLLVGSREGDKLPATSLDGREPLAARAARWGSWWNRERDYFVECARKVAPLTWTEVAAIGGAGVSAHAALLVAAARAAASTALPAAAVVGAIKLGRIAPGTTRILGYSRNDAVDVPDAVITALPAFDGRPLEAVRAELAAGGLALDDDTVRRLLDWEVLIPAASLVRR